MPRKAMEKILIFGFQGEVQFAGTPEEVAAENARRRMCGERQLLALIAEISLAQPYQQVDWFAQFDEAGYGRLEAEIGKHYRKYGRFGAFGDVMEVLHLGDTYVLTGIAPILGEVLRIEEVPMPDGRVHEVVRKQPVVAVLVCDPERNEVAFVRQQRAPFISQHNPEGYVFEVPAGHLEAGETPQVAAAREVKEETGAQIRADQVELLMSGLWITVSPGWTDEKMWLAYVELKPGQRNTTGNVFGVVQEGEYTEVLWMSVAKLDGGMQFEDLKTFALTQWFLAERREREMKESSEQLVTAKRRIEELEAELDAMRRMDDRF